MFRALLIAMLIGPALACFKVDLFTNEKDASRQSAHIAPKPSLFGEAIVQVYEARDARWKGIFSTHTWIATKDSFSRKYYVYQVNRANLELGKPALEVTNDLPDRYWFGNRPKVIAELRGKRASDAIAKIQVATENYPHKDRYEFCPGPNSNTYTAYIANEVPELNLKLSSLAVGKDYSSLKGLFNFRLADSGGFEVSICGFVFGFNSARKALLLPGFGQFSWSSE